MRGFFGAACCALIATAFVTSPAHAQAAGDNPKIASGTLKPYEKNNWPKVFAQYPEDVIQGRMMDLRKKVATAAAEDSRCDIVYLADIASLRSNPPNEIEVYAECENGFRVRIDKQGKVMKGVK